MICYLLANKPHHKQATGHRKIIQQSPSVCTVRKLMGFTNHYRPFEGKAVKLLLATAQITSSVFLKELAIFHSCTGDISQGIQHHIQVQIIALNSRSLTWDSTSCEHLEDCTYTCMQKVLYTCQSRLECVPTYNSTQH